MGGKGTKWLVGAVREDPICHPCSKLEMAAAQDEGVAFACVRWEDKSANFVSKLKWIQITTKHSYLQHDG